MFVVKVEKEEAGLSVLDFIQGRIPSAANSYLRQILKKGKVRCGDKSIGETFLVSTGDEISLPESGRLKELIELEAPVGEVSVLFESREILIVDKPAGLATHSSEGHKEDNLTVRVEALIRKRGEGYRVAPIHRLDLQTSGPVLFGKGKKACGELGKIFIRNEVEKYYLALVKGKTPGAGELKGELLSKGKMKSAHTSFKAVKRSESTSLLELRLHTGRQHQIRRQLSDLGHPLYGDARYGGLCPEGLNRLFLHCCRLAFVDPFTGASLAIESPLPQDLGLFAESLGLLSQ